MTANTIEPYTHTHTLTKTDVCKIFPIQTVPFRTDGYGGRKESTRIGAIVVASDAKAP
jgi:hypothetical protein